jgi:hypothetical protein
MVTLIVWCFAPPASLVLFRVWQLVILLLSSASMFTVGTAAAPVYGTCIVPGREHTWLSCCCQALQSFNE